MEESKRNYDIQKMSKWDEFRMRRDKAIKAYVKVRSAIIRRNRLFKLFMYRCCYKRQHERFEAACMYSV